MGAIGARGRQLPGGFSVSTQPVCTISVLSFREVNCNAARSTGGKDAEHRVIITLADGIELVVVAAGARHRQAKKRFAEGVDLIVNEANLFFQGIGRRESMKDHPPMCGADHRFVDSKWLVDSWGLQQVARDMLANQLVERDIRIEGTYQVVAV